jgi:hypothetical protein
MSNLSIPSELRIGVTGHRNLPDALAVERAVEALLSQLSSDYTSAAQVGNEQNTPIQWVVVSPLAKGADRIVARAVLKQPQEIGRPRLQVVTPFAIDDYRRDFVDPTDRAEFEELLQLDSAPTILPHEYGLAQASDSPEQRAHKQEVRNEGYLAVGQWVVDACEILIVIWNGQPAAGKGGTADIVEYAVQQGRTIFWIDSNHPEQQARRIVGPVAGV